VYNALAAAAVGRAFDIPLADAARALAGFRPTRLRSQVIEQDGIRLLNDAYNANPGSMQAALEVLSRMALPPGGRRIAVLGDMLELGDAAPDAHRRIGAEAVATGVHALFSLGDWSETMASAAVEAGMSPCKAHAYRDHRELADALGAEVRTGDLLLLKGSRGVAMERIATALGFNV